MIQFEGQATVILVLLFTKSETRRELDLTYRVLLRTRFTTSNRLARRNLRMGHLLLGYLTQALSVQ